MGHSLGLKVLAEGVETQEQLTFLATQGCDSYQGFFKSQALPSEQFVELFMLCTDRSKLISRGGCAIRRWASAINSIICCKRGPNAKHNRRSKKPAIPRNPADLTHRA